MQRKQGMAERKGFEPSRRFNTPTPLAGERLRPLGHLSEEGNNLLWHPVSSEIFVQGQNECERF